MAKRCPLQVHATELALMLRVALTRQESSAEAKRRLAETTECLEAKCQLWWLCRGPAEVSQGLDLAAVVERLALGSK